MTYQIPPTKPSSAGSLFSGALLFLFSLPFAGFGLAAAYQGVEKLILGKTKDGLFLCLFGLIFSAVGFGMMFTAIFGSRAQRRASALKAMHPQEPWLWRKDWADGRINSSTKQTLWFAWIFAGLWNTISSSYIIHLMSNGWHERASFDARFFPLVFLLLLFPLVGIGLLVWAIRETLAWKKFGGSTFKMLSVPGVPGGRLSGAIETSVKVKPEDGFHLKLVCVNRFQSGKNIAEKILWEDEITMAKELLEDDPRRSGIPVSFLIPRDARETDDRNPNNRIIWRLVARARVPGIGYGAVFELPVFRTGADAAVTMPDVDPALAYEAPKEAYQLPAQSRIKLKTLPDGGTEFYFPPARNLGTLLNITGIFLVLTAGTAAVYLLFKSVFFEVVLTLVDVLLAFACFNYWLKSSRVTINSANVRVTNQWLFMGPTCVFDTRDVAGFETKDGMTSGQTVFFNLQLRTKGGKKVTVASFIPGTQAAEWLCGELGRTLHRHK